MSPRVFRYSVWVDDGDGVWRFNATSRTKEGAERQARKFQKMLRKRKGSQVRIEDNREPFLQPDKLRRPKRKRKGGKGSGKPPKGGGRWKSRKRPFGYRARQILKGVRSKRTKAEVHTALDLAKDHQISELDFVNLVLSLGFTGSEAYTFWFSPP